MARTIEYFFTMASPWSYLGHEVFLGLAQRHGLAIDYRPVNLGPVFDETGGLPLARRHPARQRYRLVELQRWRAHRGLPLNLQPLHWPFPQGLADRAALAIADRGEDPSRFMSAVFRGVWAENRAMAERDELAASLRAAGLEPEPVLARAEHPEIVDQYDRNVREAIVKGVFGAPSYVIEGEVFWGQDRLALLAEALDAGRPALRP